MENLFHLALYCAADFIFFQLYLTAALYIFSPRVLCSNTCQSHTMQVHQSHINSSSADVCCSLLDCQYCHWFLSVSKPVTFFSFSACPNGLLVSFSLSYRLLVATGQCMFTVL